MKLTENQKKREAAAKQTNEENKQKAAVSEYNYNKASTICI